MKALLLLVFIAAGSARGQAGPIEIRVWQVDSGHRTLISRRTLGDTGDVEVRIDTDPLQMLAFLSPLRFTAGLAIYHMSDSVRVFGTVIVGHVAGGRPGTANALTFEEEQTSVRLAARAGQSIWLYPFGPSSVGGPGLAFEFRPASGDPAPAPGRAGIARATVLNPASLRIISRPANVDAIDVRVEGEPDVQYRGLLHTFERLGLDVRGRHGRRGVYITLAPAPWDGDPPRGPCYVWRWQDGSPPAGRLCLTGEGKATQSIFGSGGRLLRIERLR